MIPPVAAVVAAAPAVPPPCNARETAAAEQARNPRAPISTTTSVRHAHQRLNL